MRLLKTRVALFQNLHLLERVLPLPLKFSRDKPIFRFDSLILPPRAVNFEASTFQSLPPLLVEPQPFLLQIVRSLQAQLERRGL